MPGSIGVAGRWVAWGLLAVAGLSLVGAPAWAPIWVSASLATTAWPIARAWKGSRGTALRPAVAWSGLAVGLALVAQVEGMGEPLASGRPAAGHGCYLAMLAAMAALTSVLNARRPGSGAWGLLMALLVLVFLIPWLEGSGLAARGAAWSRLRLESPWTIFYGLLAVAGVTNFLPTRYGPAAAWMGLALGIEYAALTRPGWSLPWRAIAWSASPWALSAAIWSAEARSWRVEAAASGLDRLWLWFRDHWGVVWALRVQERFNRSAEAAGWPIRLGWFGAVAIEGETDVTAIPEEARAMLESLLRRFAEPGRIQEAGDPSTQ